MNRPNPSDVVVASHGRLANPDNVTVEVTSARDLDGRDLDGRDLDGRELDGRELDGRELDWEAILAENASWLKRILFARLGETEAVEECMQEVGLAAVRQAAPIRDPNRVGSWLYQLAIRQALLYRRKMGRKRNLLNRYAVRNQPTESDQGAYDPLHWLLDRERASMVRAALSELKDEDRDILLLKYAENMSYGEIAEQVGISHSAVEARLHRARQRLRKLIERLEGTAE